MNSHHDLFSAALNPALKILKAGAKSRCELTVKLTAKGFGPDIVAEVLNYLEKKSFLSDRRLAGDIVRRLTEVQPSGRKRIEYELERRGISTEIANEALKQIGGCERDRVEKSAREKWGSIQNADPEKRKQKVASFLAQRGFENDMIEEVLESLPSAEDE